MTITRTVRVTRQKTAPPTLSPGKHVWIRIGGYLKRCAPHPPKVAGSFPTNTPGWQGPSNATARDLTSLVGGAGLEPPTVGRRDPHLPIADGALRGSQSRASLLRGTIPPDRSRGGLARWPTIRAALAAPFTTRGDSRPPASPLRSQVHSPHIHQGGEVLSTTTTRDLATLVGGAGLEPATSSMSRMRSSHPS